MFTCEICSEDCCNQVKFFEHLKLHYGATSSVIQTAESEIETPVVHYELEPSYSYKDEEQSNISCCLCGKIFQKQKAFEAHLNQEHQQIEEFSEPEDMMEGLRHVVDMASPEPENKDWNTSEVTELNPPLVLKTAYLDNDDFDEPGPGKRRKKLTQCPHCPRTFLHRNSLMYHIRSHSGKRPHQCEVCGKGFYTANTLKVHMRMHSGDKPYKCEDCGRRFRQWGDLKYHSTSLHSDTKQYQCEYCGKNFARKYSLIIHCRIHTGEKNYVCEFCQKSFRASSYLVNHRRIHTGEKPYDCDICGKSFRVRSDMKRHRITHAKDLNFINSQKRQNELEVVHVEQESQSEVKVFQEPISVFEEVTEESSW